MKNEPDEAPVPTGTRLNRFLAEGGVASRREADDVVRGGTVTVNGQVVTDPGFRLDVQRDSVKVAGKRIWPQPLVYVLLHKPEGFVSTVEDPQQRRTVLDLLRGVRARVYPVGRLDIKTSGLLLLTNDGDLALRLTHPRYGFAKTYQAKVARVPSEAALRKLAQGVVIRAENGRLERTQPARVSLLRRLEKNAIVEITLQEGRFHQVRKMCESVGHPVLRLSRVRYGFLTAAGLPLGRWRYLTADEVKRLKESVARVSGEPAPERPDAPQTGTKRRRKIAS